MNKRATKNLPDKIRVTYDAGHPDAGRIFTRHAGDPVTKDLGGGVITTIDSDTWANGIGQVSKGWLLENPDYWKSLDGSDDS